MLMFVRVFPPVKSVHLATLTLVIGYYNMLPSLQVTSLKMREYGGQYTGVSEAKPQHTKVN
jgi:hypothetical protein